MTELTREHLIDAARRAADEADGPISRGEFERISGIDQHHIYRLFPDGGWTELRHLAGLERHPKDNEPLTDSELLAEFHRVAEGRGGIPTWAQFNAEADISADVVRRRMGGMQGTLARYREWLLEHDPSSSLLGQLGARTKHEIPAPPDFSRQGNSPSSERFAQWAKSDTAVFGPPLDFRGLRHAPINEQGVVFLFGMVAYELGFIVEAVHASFPDCEAKRSIDGRGERWQRVRIEFEFQSRNFRDHGHDPDQCDLVVCWEHNWPECPLEVLELRTAIDQLGG